MGGKEPDLLLPSLLPIQRDRDGLRRRVRRYAVDEKPLTVWRHRIVGAIRRQHRRNSSGEQRLAHTGLERVSAANRYGDETVISRDVEQFFAVATPERADIRSFSVQVRTLSQLCDAA
jgi:hypothetical protein